MSEVRKTTVVLAVICLLMAALTAVVVHRRSPVPSRPPGAMPARMLPERAARQASPRRAAAEAEPKRAEDTAEGSERLIDLDDLDDLGTDQE